MIYRAGIKPRPVFFMRFGIRSRRVPSEAIFTNESSRKFDGECVFRNAFSVLKGGPAVVRVLAVIPGKRRQNSRCLQRTFIIWEWRNCKPSKMQKVAKRSRARWPPVFRIRLRKRQSIDWPNNRSNENSRSSSRRPYLSETFTLLHR